MKLTTKQENFCLNLLQDIPQREAYLQAGYSSKMSPATIDHNASVLAKNNKVRTRLEELRKLAASDKIMSVKERMERLSEIARGRLTDYQESGLDGAGYISITKDSPNTAAISGIESATKFDEDGNTGTLFTKVRLHNPIPAIELLSKLDGSLKNTEINIDNRKIEIHDAKGKLVSLLDNMLRRESETKAIREPQR